MKILFVGHQASPGGAQNVAYRIMQGLKSRGHEIVLAFPEMGPEVMRARDAGFETHIVPVLCWHYMKGLDNPPCGIGAYLEKFTERVDRWCRELEEVKPDLIYVNTAVIIEPVIAAAMCGVPRVWHIQELFGRDADIQGSGFGDAAKLLMALPCTRILAASDAVSCELTSMVAGAAVDVVRYGLPAKNNVRKSQQDKVRGGCNSRNPVVLFAGEFSYRKGLDVLFCAIPFVLDSHPDVCFSFAGGDSRGRLDAEINRLPESYRDKIKLLGFCTDMSSVYCSADMLVLPWRGDPFPTVVIESMAAGLPVVGTRSGGMEEQIVDGSTGLLVDVDDAQQLAEAIKSLLADPERCQAMGRAAYARVTKNFTEEKMLDAVERSLKKAVRASCADESELVPQLRVLIDFVALREREHRSEIDQLQARLESVESDLRRIMDLPPVRLARFTKRILKGEKQPQPAKAAPRHGVVYFAKKKSWEWLEMMRWKLAFRFGEPAESILSVMPGLQKLSAKLLAGKASRGKSTSKEKNIYFSPIYSSLMVAPFTEDDKRLLQSLESRRSGLSEKYIERDQSILVSVVMPTYNRSHLLQRALRSLCAQSYQNWEVIVVDDGGADDTKQVIDTFADKRIRYVRHDERRGVSAARNTALSSAQGEYIAYLDSDNEWESDYLLLMLNALRERNGMRAIYCAEAIYSDGAELEGIRFAEFQYSILLHRNYIDLNVFLHHRDLYDEHGGFNETLRRLVDWDLILRYARHAVPLALPCVLVKYYQGRSAKRITDREGYWKNLKRIQSIQSADKLGLANYPAGVDAEDMYSLPSSGEPRKVGRRVSIVIPSYGVLDCLKTCVEASTQVFKQSRTP
jgi:glycosyltransferase involved in cell wall biosynthesis